MEEVVRPLAADAAVTLLLEPERFAERFGLGLAPGWLVFPESLEPITRGLEGGIDPEWFAHLIVDAAAGEVVGLGGFTGPPADGVVEIGYGVAPGRRGRGFATAAARTWVARARRAAGVGLVCAHTLGDGESASTVVLRRCGFRAVGAVTLDDGPARRWELAAPGSS